ncbi:uncharacterized protein LOC120356408 [Nilaparvata lugens]|uniref:uncharacterized protein LOC120356408 n=1 Tax=Nilaparvata lugens TaxID=108931 RepID=UPI00193EBD84|nr:uncharacterized protein LOC120356408 [Nilaparvata lugens]
MTQQYNDAAALSTGELLRRAVTPFPGRLKIAHVNAQSLLCHIDEFRHVFGGQDCDVVLVSESWLKPDVSNRLVELDGYVLLRNDRLHKNGGGVAAFVKRALLPSHKYSSDSSIPNRPEYMFLEIKSHNVKMLIGVCYRPPHIGFMSDFGDTLLRLMLPYSHIAVMGDFNTDLLGRDTYDKTQLTTMFYTGGMTLLPLQATHHTATSDTLLDLIAVCDERSAVGHGQIPFPALSAHDMVYLVYGLKSPKQKPKIIEYRDYKNINYHELFNEGMTLNWQTIYATNDVNYMVNELHNGVSYLFNKYIPLVQRRVTRDPAPWISREIRRMMAERDRCSRVARRTKSSVDFNSYKRMRNLCKQTIRNAKSRYFQNLISSAGSSACKWRRLRSVGVGGEGGGPVVSHSLDDLNNFFTDIPVGLDRAHDYINSLPAQVTGEPFYFSCVSASDVLAAVLKIKSNAIGADDLPLKFIKLCFPSYFPSSPTS